VSRDAANLPQSHVRFFPPEWRCPAARFALEISKISAPSPEWTAIGVHVIGTPFVFGSF
jgi:hypothetical protein